MKLEDKIKLIRQNAGLSQEKFAEMMGVSRQTVINWERGTVPTSFLMIQISKEFSVEFNSLIHEEEELRYVTEEMNDEVIEEKLEAPKQAPLAIGNDEPLYVCKKTFISFSFVLLTICLGIELSSFFAFLKVAKKIEQFDLIVNLVLIFLLLIGLIIAIGNKVSSKVTLYKDHFVMRKGWLKTNYTEMSFTSYQNIRIEQKLLGKIFNFGYVRVKGHPHGLTLKGVKNPYKLKEFILGLKTGQKVEVLPYHTMG
ncbi:MAG: helix-turn-helix domain-containing protein, partial [Anaeroplasmataceae bacterium]|nr:helix-turn-helix domain-containing protein [Anaeroplasmataceae bacterium]